ncbi:hypothetical protein [Sphingopyxis sp.]|uniref:hypothetical protein n=1 Tax=Sphingopyxis sp. TaxID=1908224 RepID=UPI0025E5A514|nr:hypothetical protein [Sphingopyxis sp.]
MDASSRVSGELATSTKPIWVAALTSPGVTGLPRASITLPPEGTGPEGATDTIRPSSMMIVASLTGSASSIVQASA